ncbi:uncharacterized protein MELLADRAFT_68006 [Melampsora larici-populina 98AG31]|uniref:Uncharacterized protein n=1 Tax=Melampsora larici-populina (strain 98AG31 / pathotype 3-4-7) TaxID=747676 RepID=F4S588_MELLP|nr:uncharacterized protein MELLADRAFT_68006 [Melampsora larici-populina 98AG31]EGG00201.1 hypothetical protein MELLADRAFT_68006 [Melampsora larici-populina 98AG31]
MHMINQMSSDAKKQNHIRVPYSSHDCFFPYPPFESDDFSISSFAFPSVINHESEYPDWYKPKIDISVITNDRPNSLTRLMDSLSQADYYGDEVNLILNLEQTSDLQTRKLCTNYQWNQGSKIIRQRIIHAGLLPAVIESWYPSSLHDSYGVLLEDDVEVSTQFYGYDPITSPYLSPIPCSWGALFFPESWIGFQEFLSLRLSDSLKPKLDLEGSAILSPIRSTRWPKSWKKYLIEWVYLKGKVMLYPNFWNFKRFESESLSTNHLEKGTHIHESVEELIKKTFEVNLMMINTSNSLLSSIGLGHRHLPKLINLMCVDLWGEICSLDELLQRAWIGARALGFCDEDYEGNERLIGLNELVC